MTHSESSCRNRRQIVDFNESCTAEPIKTVVEAILTFPDLIEDDLRRHGGLLDPTFIRDHHTISWDIKNGILTLLNPLRGDLNENSYSEENPDNNPPPTIKIFTYEDENEDEDEYEKTGTTIVISNIPWPEFLKLKDTPERQQSAWESPVLNALSVDGQGGKWTSTNGIIQASALFYLEMLFASNPTLLDPEVLILKSRKETPSTEQRRDQKINDKRILSRNNAKLYTWMGEYIEAVEISPTNRPVTDRYYGQLMAMDISEEEKEDLGEQLFGKIIFKHLNKNRKRILATLRRELEE